MKKKHFLITGNPGVGKTTLIQKIAEALHEYNPIGFYTAEIREGGVRQGFELVSLDGRRALLSHVGLRTPHRVGRYAIDVKGFDSFLGDFNVFFARSPLIVIDEIGKMECYSDTFKNLIENILDSDRLLLATIALKGNRFIASIKSRNDTKLIEVTRDNRNILASEIVDKVRKELSYADATMSSRKIKVTAYSGYRGDERPRSLLIDNDTIEVVTIHRMWIEEMIHDRKQKRFFEIEGDDGHRYVVCYDEGKQEWFLH